MTAEQLNATPLYSKVTYEGKTAVILKIKDGKAILWDAALGWQSFYIPADEITLVETYVPLPSGKPASISAAPLYSSVMVGGSTGVIVDKQLTRNTFTGVDYWVAMVWLPDTETVTPLGDGAFTFVDVTYPIPNGNHEPGSTNWLLYGAIAIGAYFLFLKKDKGPTA